MHRWTDAFSWPDCKCVGSSAGRQRLAAKQGLHNAITKSLQGQLSCLVNARHQAGSSAARVATEGWLGNDRCIWRLHFSDKVFQEKDAHDDREQHRVARAKKPLVCKP